ncbi:MBL fold metallo-hydrolase [uncultured Friedmanniella sp.]|uniref:MBL fold metallo-hydrolase n=1 Tax=uncultured Friedmanniella sp. TaxID=335381 RepID=UPI0035C9DB39
MPPADLAPDPSAADLELVDDAHGLVLRRVVVGPLATNCWAIHPVGFRTSLLVDPGDEPDRLLDAVSDLTIAAIVVTHTHFDHVLALPELADATGAPVYAHPAEQPVWVHELDTLQRCGHFDAGTATAALRRAGHSLQPDQGQLLWHGRPDHHLQDGDSLHAGPLTVQARHTPGHTPGSISLTLPGHVLTGDTLFPGGPGLTGWPLSDFPTIITSVRRILDLPADTVVHPGHGRDTDIATERPALASWMDRGW